MLKAPLSYFEGFLRLIPAKIIIQHPKSAIIDNIISKGDSKIFAEKAKTDIAVIIRRTPSEISPMFAMLHHSTPAFLRILDNIWRLPEPSLHILDISSFQLEPPEALSRIADNIWLLLVYVLRISDILAVGRLELELGL